MDLLSLLFSGVFPRPVPWCGPATLPAMRSGILHAHIRQVGAPQHAHIHQVGAQQHAHIRQVEAPQHSHICQVGTPQHVYIHSNCNCK